MNMAEAAPERDWKYMKKIKDELLSRLCERINNQAVAVLTESDDSEHQKYLRLYRHIEESNQVIASCSNGWRRSTLFMKILEIKHQGLLTEPQLRELSGAPPVRPRWKPPERLKAAVSSGVQE
jgi:hypothetical protein